MFMQEIPEQAFKCFETLTGLKLSYYLYNPIFKNVLYHTEHTAPVCTKNKNCPGMKCQSFDGHYLEKNIAKFPDGCIKLCHAGVYEISMPVISSNHLLCIVNAGVFRVAPEDLKQYPILSNGAVTPRFSLESVKLISAAELALYFEAMRQLCARLYLWYLKMTPDPQLTESMSEKEQLLYIIKHEARKNISLSKLAKKLHLSYSRCSHLVKEVSGVTYSELVRRHRLEYAVTMLKNTTLPVEVVCSNSGFGNIANFHRCFKKEYGISPLEMRKQHHVSLLPQKQTPLP